MRMASLRARDPLSPRGNQDVQGGGMNMNKSFRTWVMACLMGGLALGGAQAQDVPASGTVGYRTAQGTLTAAELDQIQHWRYLQKFDPAVFDSATKDKAEVAALLARAEQMLPGQVEDSGLQTSGGR